MIKKSFSLIFILFCLNAFSQEIIEKNLGSDILRAFRELKIYLPEGYVINNTKNYPLAIVFDSEQLFDAYVGNSVLFAAKDKAPKQIVVGISMKETKKNDTYFDLDTGKLTQSNSNFYEFVRDEVIFYMESTFRTSPFISLIGEGTSANLISHFLKEEKPFINSYVCINPTFSNFVNQEFDSYNLKKFSKEDNTFYLYINNSTSFSTQKQTKIEELHNSLKPLDFKNFNIINDNIVTTSSTSAIGEAIPRSLNQIFQIYSSISKEEFDKNIKDLSPLDAIEYLENKYLEIEFLFGSNLEIRDRDIYAIEKIVIEKENGDKLFELGKMILKRFPSSQLGDYYIGRYYESKKDFKKALRHYKIGYGKMDPSDPNSDKFYENVLRIGSQ